MENLMEKIISLSKRRGFVFPASEIYGGFSGFYDFGPLGVLLKENIKREWRKAVVFSHDEIVEIDSAIIQNPKTWKASGHLDSFVVEIRECQKCHRRFRVDHLKDDKCPACQGNLGQPSFFNEMFETYVGAKKDSSAIAYLRPETAQGIFLNFKNILNTFPKELPFGIAQIGKAFRNEVSPENFIFRTREFEQMELEYFVEPEKSEEYHQKWIEERFEWYLDIGLKKENLKIFEVPKEDLAHYSKRTVEIHYNYPFLKDFGELEGIANRTDFDLKTHSKFSKVDLSLFEPKSRKRFFPYIIEPSVGVERIFLALLLDAYSEEELNNGEKRVVLKFLPKMAPIKLAVFPLLRNKPALVEKAREVYSLLKDNFLVAWDDNDNIGKRYRRQDEIGTPWCVTIDFETLENGTVTLRDRDTTKQTRHLPQEIIEIVKEKIK